MPQSWPVLGAGARWAGYDWKAGKAGTSEGQAWAGARGVESFRALYHGKPQEGGFPGGKSL